MTQFCATGVDGDDLEALEVFLFWYYAIWCSVQTSEL